MKDNLSPLDRVNVRRMLLYVEKAVSEVLEQSIGEVNDVTTRNIMEANTITYLSHIKARNGISDFEVVCDETNNTPETIDNHQLNMDVFVQPIKAVDYIEVNFNVNSSRVDFIDRPVEVKYTLPDYLFRMD